MNRNLPDTVAVKYLCILPGDPVTLPNIVDFDVAQVSVPPSDDLVPPKSTSSVTRKRITVPPVASSDQNIVSPLLNGVTHIIHVDAWQILRSLEKDL